MINHQEAIKRMESVREYLCAGNPIWNVDEMREVFDMAISALQAQEAKAQLSAEGTTSDLISRQAAIDAIEKNAYRHTYLDQIIDIVSELPSAQPEIIHCRDCKHFGTDKYKKLTWCGRKDYGYGWGENDFCSRAERRTDEQT